MPQFNRSSQRGSSPVGFIGTVAALAVGAILLFCSFKGIDTGKVGVEKMFGRVTGVTVGAGANWLNPFSTVTELDTRQQNYTMSSVHSEGKKTGDDSVTVLTSDQMQVRLDCSQLWSVDPLKATWVVGNVVQFDSMDDVFVRPIIRGVLRDAAAGFTGHELYTTKRVAFVGEVNKQIIAQFGVKGLRNDGFILRDVRLPDGIMKAINDKKIAQQENEKMDALLETSRKQAEQQRIVAKGNADANAIQAEKLTPAILEKMRIEATLELAKHANYSLIPNNANLLMQAPQVQNKK